MDYRSAGVDIERGTQAVELIKTAVRSTHTAEVLAGVGAFGGMWNAQRIKAMHAPILVSSTDGVGTKTKIATRAKRFAGLGNDLVNHCINDILVSGAKPIFFLDYVAQSTLEPTIVAEIVRGAAEACKAAGCALLGGETAELPGVYLPGELDLVGTIVGVLEQEARIDGSSLEPGDLVLGLPSSGLHTNGYSLARAVLAELDLNTTFTGSEGETWFDQLLKVHKSYLPAVESLETAGIKIKAMAHITGGGLVDNPPRVLKEGLGLEIDEHSWPIPALFQEIVTRGQVARLEAYRALNMGIGMIMMLSPKDLEPAQAALTAIGEPSYLIGRVRVGTGVAFNGAKKP